MNNSTATEARYATATETRWGKKKLRKPKGKITKDIVGIK